MLCKKNISRNGLVEGDIESLSSQRKAKSIFFYNHDLKIFLVSFAGYRALATAGYVFV